ncbi:MAG: hypothetical protein B7Y80_09565 [Hyphomicrobium sp. 32-62-53]|nr:MAG: hypothetical protein B7Z29_09150 [Hyphomicrobium sp. 12-62-95]OYX99825.1 MAG: hypothetical protein B7Y80_09565 [Hyphomicrobium sp. 32-62-53]
MAAVIVIAIFWLSFLVFATTPREQVMATTMAVSYLVAGALPIALKRRHVRSQNKILDRCRAYFLLGADAL